MKTEHIILEDCFSKKEMYNINNGMLVNRKVQRFNQSNKIQNRNN